MLLADRDGFISHAESRRLAARLPGAATIRVIAGTTHRSLPRAIGAQEAVAAFLAAPVTSAACAGSPATPA